MRETLKILLMFYLNFVKATDMDSYEFNHIELTPIHDAIIFNDIANIMNELENNMNPQFENHMFSNSESYEDIEDLLSEYQQYLDKAHKQTINYIRKSKGKNKVPLLRHEKFTKLKPITRSTIENNNYYFDDIKHPPATFINKFSPVKSMKTSDNLLNLLKTSRDENKLIHLPPLLPKTSPELILSSCYCRENVIPCKCGCKQCLVIDSAFPNTFNKLETDQYPLTTSLLKPSNSLPEDNSNNDNNLNIRIKIDVQLPNISGLNNTLKYRNQYTAIEHDNPTEITKTINFPFPFLNFPIPMELIGYKQYVTDNSSPVHKITIHKKKKYRSSNNNKKHKNKKLITLHHIKIEPEMQQNVKIEHQNNSESNNNNFINMNEDAKLLKNISQNIDMQINTTYAPLTDTTNNQTFDTIYLTLNISKENDNRTEDLTKSENSIETDTPRDKDNMTTLKTLRIKREVLSLTSKNATTPNMTIIMSSYTNNKNQATSSQVKVTKNTGIDFVADTELMYWPSALKNQSLIPSKNITALILDREIRKAKLNMTDIRNNRTMALEKAIFGNVDWNNVDIVVPVFMSFVGKYIRGVLTFCSESECHSMKCAEKICHHRICSPENRYNQIGHCAGNNNTDSVATMESIMDLPSNVAFEIVDILQDKMIGKLFGKVTLCIHSKCSAFAAFKKKFQKEKCSLKDLNSTGHCPNFKNVKNM